jgi:hypothetical protein
VTGRIIEGKGFGQEATPGLAGADVMAFPFVLGFSVDLSVCDTERLVLIVSFSLGGWRWQWQCL